MFVFSPSFTLSFLSSFFSSCSGLTLLVLSLPLSPLLLCPPSSLLHASHNTLLRLLLLHQHSVAFTLSVPSFPSLSAVFYRHVFFSLPTVSSPRVATFLLSPVLPYPNDAVEDLTRNSRGNRETETHCRGKKAEARKKNI